MNTMGAFQAYISTHQLKHLDVAVVGWIFSLYAFLTFGAGLFVGPLFDNYGPKWLVLSGSVLVVLSMDLIGNCIGQYPFPGFDISLPNLYFF
jgi:MFS family permease